MPGENLEIESISPLTYMRMTFRFSNSVEVLDLPPSVTPQVMVLSASSSWQGSLIPLRHHHCLDFASSNRYCYLVDYMSPGPLVDFASPFARAKTRPVEHQDLTPIPQAWSWSTLLPFSGFLLIQVHATRYLRPLSAPPTTYDLALSIVMVGDPLFYSGIRTFAYYCYCTFRGPTSRKWRLWTFMLIPSFCCIGKKIRQFVSIIQVHDWYEYNP